MNRPHPSSFRLAIFAAAGLTLSVLLLSSAARAASNAPLPNIGMDVKRTQTKTVEKNDNGQRDNNGQSTPASHSKTNEVYYIVTLHNNSPVPAKNVEIDYTIYVKTRKTVNGNTTSSLDNVTGTETVDIPGNSSKDVETEKASHTQSSTSASNNNNGKNNRNNRGGSNKGSSTTQEIKGVWIVAKIGDNVISTYEDPPDIKAKMEASTQDQGSTKGGKSKSHSSSSLSDSSDSSDSSSDSSN